MLKDLYRLFENPSSAYRGKPFWSWNGELDRDELIRQIDVMKEMGFGGYFMHSRTGLATQYLGDEWFQLINACADAGEALGMESWLYDEDRWPSGTAGGLVTREPKYRAKYLRCSIVSELAEGECELPARIGASAAVAVFAAVLGPSDGLADPLALGEYRRLPIDGAVQLMPGESLLIFATEEQAPQSFYNGYTYLNTLSREATDAFIELTHQRYLEMCGDRLGKSIRGIFTDEPHRGALMELFGTLNADRQWLVPWTYSIFDEFANRFGYDLMDVLPDLFLKPGGNPVSKVKLHYVELLQQLFLENFARPINEWCAKHGIIFTGHVLHEDSLSAQTSMSGSMMRFYEHMGYPGVDVLSEGNRCYWIVKQLSSAARQLGKEWLLSELYGCTGWQMPFEGHKAVGDWQALFGINLRCHHLSWYTMEGEAKRDYPASILHQSAWWSEYKYVEDYFSRIGVVMSHGKPVCETLVVDPVESVWCQVHPGWSAGLYGVTPAICRLEEVYSSLFHWLAGNHVDFDYGNEDFLARFGDVAVTEVVGEVVTEASKPCLKLGNACYSQVLVPEPTTLRKSTLELLSRFIDAGGKVVFIGEVPKYVDADVSSLATEVASRAVRVPFDREAVVNSCLDGVRLPVSPIGSDGKPADQVFVQVREDGEGCLFAMLLNTDREKPQPDLTVEVPSGMWVIEMDCTTGSCRQMKVDASGRSGLGKVGLSLPPGASALLAFIPCSARDDVRYAHVLPAEHKRVETSVTEPSGPFDYFLDEPNVCVLDFAAFRTDDSEWTEQTEVLKADIAIRKHYSLPLRGGDMVQPWFSRKYDTSHGYTSVGRVGLRFAFGADSDVELPSEVFLAMEHPELFEVTLNGKPLIGLAPDKWWVDKCFSLLLVPGEYLQPGENALELFCNFDMGVNIEAVYLLGAFGVRLDGVAKTLTSLPKRLAVGELASQGLPFYSGKVTYRLPALMQLAEDERLTLKLTGLGGACAKVLSPQAGEGEAGDAMLAWHPYEADVTELVNDCALDLQVILTRRNTFGPLHQVPLMTPNYGPLNWLTEGDAFEESYQLVPAGLLGVPRLAVTKMASGSPEN